MRVTMIAVAFAALLSGTPASAQEIFSAYTKFDADKTCKHTRAPKSRITAPGAAPAMAG